MKKLITYIIPILLLLIVSCTKIPKERVLTMKDVFPTQKNTDSSFIFSIDTIEKIENNKGLYCNEVEVKISLLEQNLMICLLICFLCFIVGALHFVPKIEIRFG